ncbi:MAG TPA: gephyrin-like molybdotransferase Glp [Planctomycetota bacterium]|nr:gephyrin-like molybdotransferase Glp [Planctomycetota bacterium]
MLTPREAVSIILERVRPLAETEAVSLDSALGRVLAESRDADLDLPPFRRSAMDGYAVCHTDFTGSDAWTVLTMVGESRAGVPFAGRVEPGTCAAIYTGARLPEGADAVVMVEKTESAGERITLEDRPVVGQHIQEQGEDLALGQRALSGGRRLSPTDLSVLATVGADPATVFRRPRVTVLTTGDELVPASTFPAPGQIREGNTHHLAALAVAAGATVTRAGIAPDERPALEAAFRGALAESDLVITTGGVSMGRYDLVGETFEACGVEKVFHKVAIKPGKPIWFGGADDTLVFALPGNPVSCLLDFEVFVRPALAKLGGCVPEAWEEVLHRGRWGGGKVKPNRRQQNLPVTRAPGTDGVDVLTPVAWGGSGDIVGLARAQAFAVVPADQGLGPGDILDWRPL